MLTFKSPPSYEDNSAGRRIRIADDSKTYRVVVQASDGGATDEQLSWFKVAVTVTDEEEDGRCPGPSTTTAATLTTPKLMQFQVGASLTASVTDDDVSPAGKNPDSIRWQWYRSSSKTSMGTMIDGATESATYTTTDSGDGPRRRRWQRRRQCTFTWRRLTKSLPADPDETATALAYPITLCRLSGKRQLGACKFSSIPPSRRRVTEGPSGRNVGAPVTATDADSDLLNYRLLANTQVGGDRCIRN